MYRDLRFPVRFWKGSSADARSLVRGLLATDPEERFTVDDALASDWISQDLQWLEQKYAEVVTQQWNKHSRLMDEIRRTLQLKRDCDAHSSDEGTGNEKDMINTCVFVESQS